jgi:glycosyltransferase involved in cell wall biosynthesis
LQGVRAETYEVRWDREGWAAALSDLEEAAGHWRSQWVLLQQKSFQWSRKGLPWGFLRVLRVLRRAGTHTAVVLHEPIPFSGSRPVHQLQRLVQTFVMREAALAADRVVMTIPPDRVTWARSVRIAQKTQLIPVGSNVGHVEEVVPRPSQNTSKTIAVFSFTQGAAGVRHLDDIADVTRRAARATTRLRLLVVGRGAAEAGEQLRRALSNTTAIVDVRGQVAATEVVASLCSSDLLLYVRGHVSSRRTSAIAGIACGLPVVAYEGDETGPPLTEAGVLLSPYGDYQQLGDDVLRILDDPDFAEELARRSRAAYRAHFCWEAIAHRFATVVAGDSGGGSSAPNMAIATTA